MRGHNYGRKRINVRINCQRRQINRFALEILDKCIVGKFDSLVKLWNIFGTHYVRCRLFWPIDHTIKIGVRISYPEEHRSVTSNEWIIALRLYKIKPFRIERLRKGEFSGTSGHYFTTKELRIVINYWFGFEMIETFSSHILKCQVSSFQIIIDVDAHNPIQITIRDLQVKRRIYKRWFHVEIILNKILNSSSPAITESYMPYNGSRSSSIAS